MRSFAFLLLLAMFVGCDSATSIDRHTLEKLYQDSAMRAGVLSSLPLHYDAGNPPMVVNWWYAGTSDGQHQIVYRELTWDKANHPLPGEERYRIAQSLLTIQEPFAKTNDASGWVPLYEAALDEIEPPADLPTARKAPNPSINDPIRGPHQPVLPSAD